MSSMYAYCAFQSSEEFSALDTSCIAMSFLCGSARPAPEPAGAVVGVPVGFGVAVGVVVGFGVGVGVDTGDLTVAMLVRPLPPLEVLVVTTVFFTAQRPLSVTLTP